LFEKIDFKKLAQKNTKIKNLRLVNHLDEDGNFDLDMDGLADSDKNLVVIGDVDFWRLDSASDIEYYKFKTKDGEVRSMKTITNIIRGCMLVTEQEENGKFKYVYVFGQCFGENYMIGRLKKDEFSDHALRVFRGFWGSGAGILAGEADADS